MPGALAALALPRCPPARLLGLGAGLLAQPPAHPTLVLAQLCEEALLLGRHQRLASALAVGRLGARRVLRRNSGGRTLAVGPGTLGVLLALPERSALTGEVLAPERLLNRCVRGLLAGLTKAGVPGGARYFGRDFVSAQGRQLAVVGQDGGPEAVLFEGFMAIERRLALPDGLGGYPPHGDPRAAGPAHTCLAELSGGPRNFEALFQAIRDGYAGLHRLTPREAQDLPEAALPPAPEDEEGWRGSGVADIPIGFLEALVRVEGPTLREARLRGDFMAPAFAMTELEGSLAGCALEASALGQRVDAAFHRPGAFLLGTRELPLFVQAILAAA